MAGPSTPRDRQEPWWTVESLRPLNNPSCSILIGPTLSGKTFFAKRLLNQLAGMYRKKPPARVLFCYAVWQDKYDDLESTVPGISFRQGLPKPAEIDALTGTEERPNFLIIDDLIRRGVNDASVEDLFTTHCHHKHISCILIGQNLFAQGRHAKTIMLNATYLVLFRNARDASQIHTLARQIFPGKARYMTDAYEDAVSRPFGYLLVDLAPGTDPEERLRTNIFVGEDTVLYMQT